jgi:hypothetical protein
MRYTMYSRFIIETGQVERLKFSIEHYQQAGEDTARFDFNEGIDQFKALRMLNNWNTRGLRYIYWL